MAVPVASVGLEREALQTELSVLERRLRSKEEALRILKRELDASREEGERQHMEIMQLRSQLARRPPPSPSPSEGLLREREKFIQQLEEATEKILSTERQLQLVEDDKEELACERDYYSGRCASLVQCLEEQRSAKPPSQSAFESIMEENRKLKLDLVEAEAQRDHALSRIERYKHAVERRKAREQQQLQFLSADKRQDLRQSVQRVCELESLANSLSESVKEKSIALTHQKKANKMLATRIAELEHRLRVLEVSGLWSSDTVLPEMGWSNSREGSPDRTSMLSPEKLSTDTGKAGEGGKSGEESHHEGGERRSSEPSSGFSQQTEPVNT